MLRIRECESLCGISTTRRFLLEEDDKKAFRMKVCFILKVCLYGILVIISITMTAIALSSI